MPFNTGLNSCGGYPETCQDSRARHRFIVIEYATVFALGESNQSALSLQVTKGANMAMIAFTKNHQDLSTDLGYQFKFFCDKCGNGYMSSFIQSKVKTAGSLLRSAGQILGGFLGTAGANSYEIQRMVGGKEHDSAFRQAIEEVRPHFKQCSRCGHWVCPENCWNPERGLCEACAPNLDEERAAAQATATRDQVWQKAQSIDLV